MQEPITAPTIITSLRAVAAMSLSLVAESSPQFPVEASVSMSTLITTIVVFVARSVLPERLVKTALAVVQV